MAVRIALVVAALAGAAHADHHHMAGMPGMEDDDNEMMPAPAAGPHQMFQVGLGLIAARYETRLYAGDYQGVLPAASWMYGRFGASASVGLYRLTSNGALYYGVGDVMVSGMATLVERGPSSLSVMLPLMLPTGNMDKGFGMGHVMAMPMIAAATSVHRIDLGASIGFGYSFGAHMDHDHGVMPLVDPMNMREVMWSANAYVPLARALHAGVRLSGGAPIGNGTNRVVGGVRAIWIEGNVETAFEVQGGIDGDPFKLRGLVESAVHF